MSNGAQVGLVLALLLVGLLPRLCAAADGLSPVPPVGAWALQFSIRDDFALGEFRNGLLTIKNHLSNESAVRFGVSGRVDARDTERSEAFFDTVLVRETDVNEFQIEARIQYQKYLHAKRRIVPYVAIGPLIEYRRWSVRDVESEQKARVGGVGLLGNMGAEWFPTTWLGLHAEYGIRAQYRYEKLSGTSGSVDRSIETDQWSVGDDGVLFGLSVYF